MIRAKYDEYCHKCRIDEETSYHYLGICEVHTYLRLEIFGVETLDKEDLPPFEHHTNLYKEVEAYGGGADGRVEEKG